MRQLSIALITFNCACVMWPRMARRQAGPWSRKMSATSSDGRGTVEPIYSTASRLGLAIGIGSVSRSSGLSIVRKRFVATCV